MNRVSILDCTLRDGGYCNEWKFGNGNIKKIINSLVRVNIEIIECGILSDNQSYDADSTIFRNIEEIAEYLPGEIGDSMAVCLVNFGKYQLENLPFCDGRSVTGIRVAFHKKNLAGAMEMCKQIKNKGYKLFMQPMVSLNYSDEEFLRLICKANEIHPYAFYIVDSFGAMAENDLKRLFRIADHNLEEDICIGFHSHNNMQMSYANAQTLASIQTPRKLIVDSSIMGMGRGAGNLNTELFAEYLNRQHGKNYNISSILVVIDQILGKFYQNHPWGYSLANYLSAKNNMHPDYANYLDKKQTLTIEDIDKIFLMMEKDKKAEFDQEYIEGLYVSYMGKMDEKTDNLDEFKRHLSNKEVLLIAPGSSSRVEKEKIISKMKQENVLTISINFDYPYYKTDYIFLSNLRRYQAMISLQKNKYIITSNIPVTDVFLKAKYTDLLNDNEFVRDNAGMMLIKFLIKLGVKKIQLAGMDGYLGEAGENYLDDTMTFPIRITAPSAKNRAMSEMLGKYSKDVLISFLTRQRYVRIGID